MSRTHTRMPPSLTMLAAALPLLLPVAGHAATGPTLEVLNCNDSGAGSLRQVVASAPSGALVDLTGLACRRIDLTSGAIEVTQDDLALQGRGISAITIDGGLTSSVFRHSGAGRLKLQGLTVQRGVHQVAVGDARGGCVYSQGEVELRHARVRWCRARSEDGESEGGAVYAEGALTVFYSRVLGNTADHAAGLRTRERLRVHHSWICSNHAPAGTGGGVYADSGMKITHSTLSRNKGGAIRSHGEDTVIAHSTISDNSSHNTPVVWIAPDWETEDGGGAEIINSTISGNRTNNSGILQLSGFPNSITNSTIALNAMYSTPLGVGCPPAAVNVIDPQSPLHLDSTIIANNSCDGAPYSDLWIFWPDTPAVVGANNLVMQPYNVELPPDTLHLDPMLEPLASNGGPTETHALPLASPAVDNGNNAAGLSWDQRGSGFPRVKGDRADIGAYER